MRVKALFCSGSRQKQPTISEDTSSRDSRVGDGDLSVTDSGFTRSYTGDILMQRGFSDENASAEMRQHSSSDGNRLVSGVNYGGNFTWVEAVYKMKVKAGLHPLAVLNGLTKRLMVMQNLVLMQDGSFRRPHESVSMFPVKGVSLWWRWEEETGRVIIDFYTDGKLMPWRWDELRPSEPRFPSTTPDLVGVGHVGKFSFEYSLLSAEAEAGALPSTITLIDKDLARIVDSPLTREPRGEFCAGGLFASESRSAFGDFARLFCGDASSASLLCLCPGLEAPKVISAPYGVTEPLGDDGIPEELLRSFAEQLEDAALLGAPESMVLPSREVFETVARRAALAMGAAVGSAFALSRQLLPELLQTRHIVISLGRPLEFRLLTYAFVAEMPSQVQGKLGDDASTPFVARLLSPVLNSDQCAGENFRYVVSVTKEQSIAQFQRRDLVLVRKVVAAGQWSRLF